MCDPSICRIKNKNIITFGGYYERKNNNSNHKN